MIATAKTSTSPKLAESRKATNLRMLSPMRRPASDRGDDRREVVVGEHDRCGLARGLGSRAPHRDSDVGAAKRGCVVDAVAGDGDHLAARLQLLDERELRGRRRACDDVRLGEAEGVSDRPRRRRMVAGEHAHRDAGAARFVDRRGCGWSQRVVQRDEAQQLEVGLEAVVQVASPGRAARVATASTRKPSEAQASASSTRSGSAAIALRGDDLGRALAVRVPAVGVRCRRPSFASGRSRTGSRARASELASRSAGAIPRSIAASIERRLDRVAEHLAARRSRAPPTRASRLRAARSSSTPRAGRRAATRILFSVSVPVLSVQMTVVSPSVVIASSRRTIAPRRASDACAERERGGNCRSEPLRHGRDGDRDADEEGAVKRLALQDHRRRERDGQKNSGRDHLPGQVVEAPLEWRRRWLGRRR